MKPSLEELKKKLNEKGINLSHQRLKVLEYLILNQDHPTADQIYSDLHKEIATLSKTTVYNILRILVEAGLVRILSIDNNESRYDIITKSHGHFMCEACQTIYNFNIDIDSMDFGGLNDFTINEKDVYFKGLCPKCILNIKNVKEDK